VNTLISDLAWTAEISNSWSGTDSIWSLPLLERQVLVRQWEKATDADDFAYRSSVLYNDVFAMEREIEDISNQRDIMVMAAHKIVGVTTTACAGRWEQLRSLSPEILVCEEAAELLEVHQICALLLSLEHAILIGDPQQLCPEDTEQDLGLESPVEQFYRLDEFLLERLMIPLDASSSTLPTSRLSVQRRMRPCVADIARLTYPYLSDRESTIDRCEVHGMEERMFWWTHSVPELQGGDDLKSHANLYEVEMVAGLVGYLVRGGAYSQVEVTVLTPHAGQLLALKRHLAATCFIWLNEKDCETLLDEEILALGDAGRLTEDEVAISDMLKITTVDVSSSRLAPRSFSLAIIDECRRNFQGNESKIIVLSTVCSSSIAGFPKSLNRVNIACSRAQNGFYIIDNSQTLSQTPRWQEIIDVFGARIRASIIAHCHEHSNRTYLNRRPQEFESVPKRPAICGHKLECEHLCMQNCHLLQHHDRFLCEEQCGKLLDCQEHECAKLCHKDQCGPFLHPVTETSPLCSHPGSLFVEVARRSAISSSQSASWSASAWLKFTAANTLPQRSPAPKSATPGVRVVNCAKLHAAAT
jgi:hypothetical protein